HQIVVLGVVGSSPTSHPKAKADGSWPSAFALGRERNLLLEGRTPPNLPAFVCDVSHVAFVFYIK
ncbi:MAG: hypothetical protein MJZ17_02500, partial [Bacteroidales bacterium]|nr:hypothetical protein [Bacteroidales bacterium]